MLTRAELRILPALHKPTSLKELSAQLGLSRARLSVIAKSLEEKGLVERRREGREIVLYPSSARALEVYHELSLKFPHIDFTPLLAGRNLKVIGGMAVEKPRPAWEIALRANMNRYTVHHVLAKLMESLIVGKNKEGYFITKRFSLIRDFVDEYFHLQNSIKAKRFSGDALVVWSGVNEFILATRSFKGTAWGSFQLTGLSRFGDFGLNIVSAGVYHYYWPSEGITLEEAAVHALTTTEPGARELLYIITLLRTKGFSVAKLRRLALKFDVLEIVEEIIEYLNGGEKGYPFPSLEEVEELYRQYFEGHKNDNKGEAD
ncbi:winged helix-turn-helix domain-containing protein [Thermococcus sp.]|uniref:winged helix-turn-helix domain-containing protein n=1 Tax=Thermococcus sp. TaxID=35749 RepID=UPI0025DF064D|nr:winged helix-turn-helix domain-containing protein [Thermococcus sp.]